MKIKLCIKPLVALSLLFAGGGLSLLAQSEVVFVENGVVLDSTIIGAGVVQNEDHVVVEGTGTGLIADLALMGGDFHIEATMAFDLNGTAALFAFGLHGDPNGFLADPTGFIGFDSGSQTFFVGGNLLNPGEATGPASEGAPASDFIQNSVPFLFEAKREGETLTVSIDGVMIYTEENIGTEAIGYLGIRPWRAAMQVYDFRATGNFADIVLPTKTDFGEFQSFVVDGVVDNMNQTGGSWEKVDNYVVAQGTGIFLQTTLGVLEGDFHIEAELALNEFAGTASSFQIGGDNFGFDGGKRGFFQSGGLWAPGIEIGPAAQGLPAADFIVAGEPFTLEAKRVGDVLTILINGEGVFQKDIGTDAIGVIGFRPWRAEMRVYNLRVAGNVEASPSMPRFDNFGQVRYISFLGNLTGGNYELGELASELAPFIDDELDVASFPASLEGNLAIRTSNAQSGFGEEFSSDTPVGFVVDGIAINMHEDGSPWTQGEGYLVKQGTGNHLLTDSVIMGGDFHVKSTLEIDAFNSTAAAFFIGGGYFGFDGSGAVLFIEMGIFGGRTFLQPAADFIQPGVPFLFEVIREGDQLRILLDGVQVHQQEVSTDALIGQIGPRPWRSEMKIFDLQVTGNHGWSNYLAFELDRATTVYVANDPAFEPGWLTNRFSQTGMVIETTGGNFDVWAQEVDARDFVMLPGHGGSGHNYWVILSEKPSAITADPSHYIRSPGGSGWNLARNSWKLTTDPEAPIQSAGLLTQIANFQPESGIRMGVDLRVPQLQHEGDNAYSLLLVGDSTTSPNGGIRAEWLPLQAGGGSTLQLVDIATGAVLAGDSASASWGGNVPVRTNDFVLGDEQIELMWDPRASELDSTYFKDDGSKVIVRLPDGLDPGFIADGIKTENDLSNTSETFLQFTVQSGEPTDGNAGVTVFVAWDIRNSGLEPDWLTQGFSKTDHLVQVSSAARYHRLWAAEYAENSTVTLPGASAGGAGPFVDDSDNYFVLLGDTRADLDSVFKFETEAVWVDDAWQLSATLTDADGFSETVSATFAEALAGQNVFGVFVRHLDREDTTLTPVTPIWETFSLSMDFITTPPLAGFAAWAADNFPDDLDNPLISGPDAAPAGDGVPNLIKYALDLAPLMPASAADLPQANLTDGGDLVLVYWERTDVDDVLYTPQVSTDLNTWQSGSTHLLEVFRNPADGNIQEVGVRSLTLGDAERAFIRLKINQNK